MALEQADYDMTDMAHQYMDGFIGGQHGPQPGDEKLAIRFFNHPVQNKRESKEEGRPIFHEVEHVQVAVPGDKTSIVIREATDQDRERFPRHYEAFKARTSQDAVDGTPLSAWPQVTRAQVEELAYFEIRTVEQLAGMSDALAGKFMGINQLRDRARVFLEETSGQKPLAELMTKNEELVTQLAEERRHREALSDKLDKLIAAQEVMDDEDGPKSKRKGK